LGAEGNLYSGVFGGAVYEPMIDLTHLFAKLVKSDSTILIPSYYDVAELTGMPDKL